MDSDVWAQAAATSETESKSCEAKPFRLIRPLPVRERRRERLREKLNNTCNRNYRHQTLNLRIIVNKKM